MKIKEIDYSTDEGFGWIVFTHDSEEYTLQTCLMERKDKHGYKKVVDAEDSGIDWGLCGDANNRAFDKFGVEFCEKFLFSKLRSVGIKTINR